MAPFKDLQSHEVQLLHEWLRTMGMPVNRHMSRNYSDAVMVAKLLNQLYPKYAGSHGYQARFSQELKMVNWHMLHFKILSKIGLPLTREYMHNLAKGDSKCIERLLWAIMNSVQPSAKEVTSQVKLTAQKSQIMRKTNMAVPKLTTKSLVAVPTQSSMEIRPITKQENKSSPNLNVNTKSSEIVDITEEAMIPYAMYESLINEIQLKDKNIQKYESKISSLEALVKEKSNEIDVLKKRVSQGLLNI